MKQEILDKITNRKLDYIILEREGKVVHVSLSDPITKKTIKTFESEKELIKHLDNQNKLQQ